MPDTLYRIFWERLDGRDGGSSIPMLKDHAERSAANMTEKFPWSRYWVEPDTDEPGEQ